MARRGRLVLLSVAVGATLTFAALPGQAETLRSGLARAQLAKIVPYVGIPSVGAGAGVAQAEIQGASAHASAGMADFGSMSMILGAVASKAPVPLPDLPGPITADDRDHPDVARDPVMASATPPAAPPVAPPGPPSTTPSTRPPSQPASAPVVAPLVGGLTTGTTAAAVTTAEPTTTTTAPAAAPPAAPAAPAVPTAAWEEAHAAKTPASRATVRGPELGVPGVITLTGAESRASADGGVSSSTVTLGRLVLGGASGVPEVVLSNLVWTARQAMGKPGTAGFTIGSVTVAGQALPLPAGVAPADVLKSVNDALAPAGLRLEIPVSTGDAGGATVSSLVVQVRNPETVAGLVGQATQPAVPVLNQLLDTLLAAAPDAAGSRLVVNALLATGTTRGGGRLELGGAAARIGNVEVADLPAPVLPPVDAGDTSAFAPPFAADAVPSPSVTTDPSADSASGNGLSSSGYESSLPLAAPTAPPGAARTPLGHAAPGGSTVATRPVGTTAPGGASAPLVLGAALLAVLILALGDKLRLRRSTGA